MLDAMHMGDWKRLFRYRAPSEFTFADIGDNCTWFSSYDALNDPFEGNYVNYSDDLSVDALIRTLRAVCFSGSNDNLLLWAHYAANHAGLCLEYRFEPKDFREQCFPVTYSSRQPVLATVERYPLGHPSQGSLKVRVGGAARAFLTKSLEWSYEEEHRVLRIAEDREAAGERKPLPGTLNAIYLGLRATQETQKRVIEVVADRRHIALYRARLADGEFKLRFEKVGGRDQ